MCVCGVLGEQGAEQRARCHKIPLQLCAGRGLQRLESLACPVAVLEMTASDSNISDHGRCVGRAAGLTQQAIGPWSMWPLVTVMWLKMLLPDYDNPDAIAPPLQVAENRMKEALTSSTVQQRLRYRLTT